MAAKGRKSLESFEHLALRISEYSVRVCGGINPDLGSAQLRDHETQIYSFYSGIELVARVTWPPERENAEYQLSIYGKEARDDDFKSTLKDCHVRSESGELKYRRVRGKDIPVYEIPTGIGFLKQIRKTKNWMGAAWMEPRVVSDMLSLLPNVNPLFISLTECRIGRTYRISSLTLQTTDPAEE